jgi:hypothetical protein
MISVIATLIFFILLFVAFINNKPAKTSHYQTFDAKAVIMPSKVINTKNLYSNESNKLKKSNAFGLLMLYSSNTFFGIPLPGQKTFQLPATPIMEGLIDLHHDIMAILVFIIVFVFYMLTMIVYNFHEGTDFKRNTSTVTHNTFIEIV